MFCSKCGSENVNGSKFCKKCGWLLENAQQNLDNNYQGYTNQSGITINQEYINNAVHPNMKKWAIISVIAPSVGLFMTFFTGISLYVFVFLITLGFTSAKKGKTSNEKLASTGKILCWILVGLYAVTFIGSVILALID